MRLIPHEGESENFPVWEVAEEVTFHIAFEIFGLGKKNHPNYGKSCVDITVPKGFLTDLGSVPKFSLIQPVRFPRPAVLHDFAYRNKFCRGTTKFTPAFGNGEEEKPFTDHSLDWLYDPSDGYKNQKDFYDRVLYEQCRRHCKSLSRSAPRRIYWAVRMFGGLSFLDLDAEIRILRIHNKIYPK